MDFAEIEKFIDTPVKRYSNGMYVHLAFAVAAHLEPEILLVDEVLAVGDAGFQKKCLGKMDDFAKHGRTVLFVSHNMGAVNALCQRGVLLDEGKTEYCGDTEYSILNYQSQLTRISNVSLDERKDRIGSGVARLADLTIENLNGDVVDAAWSGGDFMFHLSIRLEDTVFDPIILISFYNVFGQKLFHCNSEVAGPDSSCIKGFNKMIDVYCIIPRLPLPSGEY